MNLQECLEALADDRRDLKHSDLMLLSGLTTDELRGVANAWLGIVTSRKMDLLEKLREISEDNLEADFNDLLKFCLKDDDPGVKERAIEGLWECEDRVLVTALIELLSGDPSHTVRAKAATGLGKFAGLAQIGKMLAKDSDRIKNSLVAVVQDQEEDWGVRRRAVEAVGPFNTDDVHSMIGEAYFSDRTEMRYSAIYAMGKNGHPAWIPILIAEVSNEDPAIRYEAAAACGKLGDPSSINSLHKLLTQEDDAEVIVAAIHALGAIGGPAAKHALVSIYDPDDEVGRDEITSTLEILEDEESVLFGGESEPSP